LRRLLLPLTAALALALPATASAQLPVKPPKPPNGGVTKVDPNLRVRIASGIRDHKKIYVVAGQLVAVHGRLNKGAAGDHVVVELWRDGKRRSHRKARVFKSGRFHTKLRTHASGRYYARAVFHGSKKVKKGKSKRAGVSAVRGHANYGDGGPRVRILQRMLARMGYAVHKSGRYDTGTGRAVLAYRKVNKMRRITSANYTIFKRVFGGRGTFRLKYPHAGKHVEADLSRQVVVLAQDGKAFRVYNTSSGKPSTPTIKGSFSFYRRGPGYNSEGMYYSTYFIRGYAIHGYHSVPTYAASHGCLRVYLSQAVAIYNWIDLGDRIFVYGRGKQPGKTAKPGP
jgi:lipoprotein-anchoring transpeptidase ErfK/SrfK